MMVTLPRLKLTAEREALIQFFCKPCEDDVNDLQVRQLFKTHVLQMADRHVLDCVAVVKG
ncbi:MAG: hypothetical protein CMN96_03255 [Synechococcus sp. MED850]|jgi:hypothetical protein|nr:hypothetical protein [Synechococcus sp. MED850]OUW98581.1 MAG: hypothetical protein CBD89_01980 [Cyanobacteria bacterium TMED229]